MTFKQAVEETPSTQNRYRKGLQGLRAVDRDRVSADDSRCLTGSVDLDDALRNFHPNTARWDYGVAYRRAKNQPDHVHWIEVHAARTSTHLDEVRAKLVWLKNWLASDGKRLAALNRSYVWISTGKSEFIAGSPQIRGLAELGLSFAGRHYRVR